MSGSWAIDIVKDGRHHYQLEARHIPSPGAPPNPYKPSPLPCARSLRRAESKAQRLVRWLNKPEPPVVRTIPETARS